MSKSERAHDITDTKDIAKAAREFVASSPAKHVPEKLILHMAAEIEVLRKDVAAWRRRGNAFRRKASRLELGRP